MVRKRKARRFRLATTPKGIAAALAGVGLLAAIAACLPEESVPEVAGLELSLRGSAAVRGVTPAVSEDGYSLVFERALVAFLPPYPEPDSQEPGGGGLATWTEEDGTCFVPDEASLVFGTKAPWVYSVSMLDLARDEALPPFRVWRVRPRGCPRFVLSLTVLLPAGYPLPSSVVRNPSYRPEDYADLRRLRANVALRARATRGETRVTFDLNFQSAMLVGQCGRDEGRPGLAYRSGEYTSAQVELAAERMFADDPLAASAFRMEPFVGADVDGDGVVTATELLKTPTAYPAEIDRVGREGQRTVVRLRDLLDVLAFRMTHAWGSPELGSCVAHFFVQRSPPRSEDGGTVDGAADVGSDGGEGADADASGDAASSDAGAVDPTVVSRIALPAVSYGPGAGP